VGVTALSKAIKGRSRTVTPVTPLCKVWFWAGRVWFRFLGQIIVYRLDHSAFFAKDDPAQGGKVVFLR